MVTTSNIYKISNLVNGKVYIGKSIDIERRWEQHKKDYLNNNKNHKYLYRAMKKYGIDNFIFEIIEENLPDESVDEREKYWISFFNCKAPNGYNLTDGGEGSIGREMKESTRQKLIVANTGKTLSVETKQKKSVAMKEYMKDENNRKKISETLKNNSEFIEGATERIMKVNQSMNPEVRLNNLNKAVEQRRKPVIATCLEDESIQFEFNSLREARDFIRSTTEFVKACHTNISKTCRGKLDYVYGYKWEYKL